MEQVHCRQVQVLAPSLVLAPNAVLELAPNVVLELAPDVVLVLEREEVLAPAPAPNGGQEQGQ